MLHTPIISATRPLIILLALTAFVAACKPEAPDLHEARRPVASETAKVAKAAIEAGTAAPAKVSGLTAAQAQSVVARVGAATITLGDVAAYMAQLPRSARSRYVTAEQRVELLRKLVELELLAHEGERKGFKTDPIVQHTYKKALADEVLRTVGTDLSLSDITEEDVTAYYRSHTNEFVREERRRCAVLYSNTRADAVAASAGLMKAIEATPKAAKQIFGDWAREKSVDVASATVKGDLGWFDAKGLNNKGQARVAGLMLSTVFNLDKVHQVSPPLQLESKQWVIVQLTGREAAKEAPLDEVRLAIQNALLKAKRVEARVAFIKTLREQAKVTVNEEALNALPKPEPVAKTKVPDVPKPVLPTRKAPTAAEAEAQRADKAAEKTPKTETGPGKAAKPRLNPALFRRPGAPSATLRPGQGKGGLTLQHSGPKVPDAAKARYLGPGQPPEGDDSQGTK